MTTNITNPANWIALRANEPEFLAFLSVTNKEEAIAAATTRSVNAAGQFDTVAFTKLKDDYLSAVRLSMGLPSNAGAF